MTKEIGSILQSNGENFKLIGGNRMINLKKVAQMVAAMKENGGVWLGLPALVAVSKESSGWVHWIMEAQHRGTGCIQLGLPITYIIYERINHIATKEDFERWLDVVKDINNKCSAWKSKDWLDHFCQRKVPQYIAFRNWMDSVEIQNVDLALYLVGRDNSSKTLTLFKDGIFKFDKKNEQLGTTRLEELRCMEAYGGRWLWINKFTRAYFDIRMRKGFDFNRLLDQLKRVKKHELFQEKGNRQQYVQMFHDIYNYAISDKVCLLF